MRILLVGASGTIGQAVSTELGARHDVILASRQKSHEHVDISDAASIKSLLERVGRVDAIACAAGNAAFKPLTSLANGDFSFSIENKLMGQVNLILQGLAFVNDGGSITITGGTLAQNPMPGGAAISMVNAALEGFTRGAALEAPRRIRVNLVSPPWVSETLVAMGMPPENGLPAATVAKAYARAIEGKETGQVIVP